MGNATCHVESSPGSPSLLQNGDLVFQAHHVGWIVAGFFTVVAVIASFWLVNKHLQWYTNKREQRYIVRLLFMVPIYAVISLASYLFWNHATPLLLIRDAYEATVLTAFFYLLLTYLSPDPEDQKAIFLKVGLSRAADAEAVAKGEEPKKWMFPLGFIKSKPADGLYFLQMMKWGVLQYCVIRPLTTISAVTLNYIGWYCEGSFSPQWGYVYITVIVSISVSIAMYCLIQVYMPISVYLAPHKPLLKLFSVKAVVFLTFWQATMLSVLSMFGVVKDTTYMSAEDINIGIAALAETFEMMLFAFLHLKAFSYKPYRPFHDPKSKAPPPVPTPRLRSLGHALDFRETFREIRVGWIYILDKMRGREPTPDMGARRIAHYESAFGRPRPSNLPTSKGFDGSDPNDAEKGLLAPSARQLESRDDTPWLGLPGYERREKSEALEVQIERELQRRGYGSHIPGRGHIGPAHEADGAPGHKPQRSWWRSVYSRVSQSGPEPEDEQGLTAQPSKRKKSKSRTRGSRGFDQDRRLLIEGDYDFDDQPPPSVLRRQDRQQRLFPQEEHLDTLAPLSVFTAHRSSQQVRQQKDRQQKDRSASNPTPSHPKNPDPPMSYSQPLPSPPMMGSPSQIPLGRADSLLGRVFPPSASNASSVDHAHGSDSGRSLPSVSTHGVTPSRATPRGRLILTVPQILGKTTTPDRLHQYVTPTPQQVEASRSVEVVHSNGTEPAPQVKASTSRGSHMRETAHHRIPDERPVLTLNTTPDGLITSPLSADLQFDDAGYAPSVTQPQTSQNQRRRSNPPPSLGLRRSAAQVYSPDSPSRRNRRQSVDVNPPQVPASSYSRPRSGHPEPQGQRQSNRRMSTPMDAAPHSQYTIPLYQEELLRSGYTVENMRSDITQPSLSATPNAVKYPTVMPSSNERPRIIEHPSRLPGMPQPPTPTQLSYPDVGPPFWSHAPLTSHEETRRMRPPGAANPRLKDPTTRTTRPRP
ncbi:organic solute transporter Ostalpha-domain-containing protein [Mycena crocata]|nr:organic solute transporter Ostalpha-domain-containing protein [Mycena crocata]